MPNYHHQVSVCKCGRVIEECLTPSVSKEIIQLILDDNKILLDTLNSIKHNVIPEGETVRSFINLRLLEVSLTWSRRQL